MQKYLIIGVIILTFTGTIYGLYRYNQNRLEDLMIINDQLLRENETLQFNLDESYRQSDIIRRNISNLNTRINTTNTNQSVTRIENFNTNPLPEVQNQSQQALDNIFKRLEDATR